jgi:hypothetical protein
MDFLLNLDFSERPTNSLGSTDRDCVLFDEDDAKAEGLFRCRVFGFVERSFKRVDCVCIDTGAESDVIAVECRFGPWSREHPEWAFERGKNRVIRALIGVFHPHADVNQILSSGTEFARAITAFDVPGNIGDVVA